MLKYFNKRNPEIYYPSFMSTSIKPYDVMTGKVKWNLKLNDGVKYMYIEDLPNAFNTFGYSDQSEAELLVLPGQRIKILGAKYINNKYHIYGEILPAKENLK